MKQAVKYWLGFVSLAFQGQFKGNSTAMQWQLNGQVIGRLTSNLWWLEMTDDECYADNTNMIRKWRSDGTLTDRWNGKTNRNLNSSMCVNIA
jgi:hypothetical protein